MQIKFQSVLLFVSDIKASRFFYETLLGQTVVDDFGVNLGCVGGLALWQADAAYQIVYGRAPDAGASLGRENLEAYFETDDLEAAWKLLAEAGVRIVHPLRDQPWGQRVFDVLDPDGHLVELGEPMGVTVKRCASEGLTAEQIASRTYMPLEAVRQLLAASDA